jgi:serpin B
MGQRVGSSRRGARSAAADLAKRFNDFGLALVKELPRGENTFVSPIGIAMALGALAAGARGGTGLDLMDLLRLGPPADDLPEHLGRLAEVLSRRGARDFLTDPETGEIREIEREAFRLQVANALFVQGGYRLVPAYFESLKKHIGAEVESLDFADPGPASRRINEWVAARTEGKIAEIMTPDALTARTRLVLVNAVYFLAAWLDSFDEELTRPKPFFPLCDSAGASLDVPMMANTGTYRYGRDDELGLGAVEIPYEAMSMLLLLPDRGRFDALEASLSGDFVDRVVGSLAPLEVALELPKFELESSYRLSDALGALGAGRAFDESNADFGGISDDPEGLFVSEVIHRARIRVDENGTEAAAATALDCLGLAEPGETEAVPFVVDRPFFFAIRDEETGALLFLGRVSNPAA